MSKTTSINFGDHFGGFISPEVESRRYGSASEAATSKIRLPMSKIHIRALAENGLIGISHYSFKESGADQAAA